jgi:hypothetical protein
MAELHQIKAWLYDNILNSDDPSDLVARVPAGEALGMDDISRRAAARCGDIPEEVIMRAVSVWLREMAGCLCDGLAVDAGGWFTASPGIKGSFNSPFERFNPEKHTLWFDFRQGVLLRQELEAVEVDIPGMAAPAMDIVQVVDIKTGSVNDLATPTHPLRICGTRLTVAGSHPDVGVWFVNRTTGGRTRVAAPGLLFNKPGELIVTVPGLPAGTYTVEVTTQHGAAGNAPGEPCTAAFARALTVR